MNILIAGDYCPKDRLADIDYSCTDVISSDIRNKLHLADFSIVNLECPVKTEHAIAIKKQGPTLGCDPSAIEYLKEAGFTTVTCANNHILDYGTLGLNQTLSTLESVGLEYVGVGRNMDEASRILYLEKDGQRVAIINCCEQEFSIATLSSPGANKLDPIRQFYKIQEAKKNSDYVMVIVHGGIEHFQLPTLRMKETYRFFVDSGADVVINHHQHCYCGCEEYNGKPIFYGLGNFCFDWEGKRKSNWNEGYVVDLQIDPRGGVEYDVIPYVQCDDNIGVECMNEKQLETFRIKIAELNLIINNDELLSKKLEDYMESNYMEYQMALEPYSSRYGLGFFRRGLLPSFLNSKRILKLYDFVMCVSHRTRLEHYLQLKYKELSNE